jgi:hypothetical protein
MVKKKTTKKVAKKVTKPDERKHPKMVCWVSLVLMFLCGWIAKDLVSKVYCSDCDLNRQNIERRIHNSSNQYQNLPETVRERGKRFNREKSNAG